MKIKRFFKILIFLIGSFLVVMLFLYGLLVGGIYWGLNHIPENEFAQSRFENDQRTSGEKRDPLKITRENEKKSESLNSQKADKEKMKINQFRVLFLEVDEINLKTSSLQFPSICELICQESFSKRHDINLSYENFYKYFNDYPEEFLHDPASRLLLNILNNYRKIFTREMFEIYNQIEKLQENRSSDVDKIKLSNSIVFNILFFAKKLSSDYEMILKESKTNRQLIQLNKSCENKTMSEIKSECESLIHLK